MANHKSSIKRNRSNKAKELRNKYQGKTTRNAIKNFRDLKTKKEAVAVFPKLSAMLDKLAKKNIIHKNKPSNLKSELQVHLNHLQ